MKTLRNLSLLFVLFLMYTYIISIDCIPKTISIFKGEQIKISTLWGIKIVKQETSVEASTPLSTNTFENTGNETLTVSLFDKIPLRTIDVNVMEEVEVIPIGEVVGVKLYTSGVLVVGTSGIEGMNGDIYKPFENSQIEEGDAIISINNNLINNTDELIKQVNESDGKEIEITYIKNNKEEKCKITPIKNKDNEYKIGLWVRDSAAGVGTVTFYNEKTNSFAALGHGITDIDTGDIINTSSGEIDDVNIISIVKGEKEEPGKLQGTIKKDSTIGNIYKNTQYGIYGVIKNASNLKLNYSNKMKVASRQDINLGEAKILCGVDGEIKEYKIEIQKIFTNNNYDNKSMLIKVTDEELLQKTGGIIQGMSGSPIIQDDKIIGCVTHVSGNNPMIGFGLYIEWMLEMDKQG